MGLFCCLSNEVQDVNDESPRKVNRCTDSTFLMVFILFLLGLIFVAVYAFSIGNPLRMIHGSDSFGNVCGHKNSENKNLPFSGLDLRKRPYLFHLNQREPRKSIKICVHKCPKENLNNMAEVYAFFLKKNSSLCRYDFEFTSRAPNPSPTFQSYTQPYSWSYPPIPQSSNETGLCPVFPVDRTRNLLYHCVPEMAIIQGMWLGHSMYDFISSYVPLKKVFSDIINSYEEMIIMGIVAILSSFISAFVIHFVAYLASWLILILISILLIGLTIIFWYAYIDARYRFNTINISFLPEDLENESILLTISIICTIVTLIILYAAASMRSHVQFVVALFHETAACIRSMPLLLLQPLWTLFALISFFLLWMFTMMALSTAHYASRESRFLQTTTDKDLTIKVQMASYTLINYRNVSWIHYMWWYLVIAFVWISEFILSCQQMVIAGAVSSWYFSRDRDRLDSPIWNSVCNLATKHIGTVALGSFLITLFKLPRLIIQQWTSRLRQYDNQIAKTALKACTCCLYVVEKFLACLTRNAYTVVVIEHTNFCVSARLAFQALVSNALRVAAINSIGDFILLLGKLIVASLTAIVGVFLIRSNPSIHYWTVPVILMSLFGFWVAHCLLSVYEMVIDAMFLCFCQDMNRNDGSPGNEYYAPESLMRFLIEDENMVEIRTRQPNDVKLDANDDYSSIK